MSYEESAQRSNELILNPGEYAFLQDKTTGGVQTHVGPIVVTQTGQLRPIKFRNGHFEECALRDAVVPCVRAEKGQYLILHNPTVDENGLKHPTIKSTNTTVPELRHGEKLVVPGPVQYAQWPEQYSQVVDGHNLRDDQFLLVRVYDEEAASANWENAIVQGEDEYDVDAVVSQDANDLDLTLGKLLIIKGVSFYIPPTGVEVVVNDQGLYIRDALTLEMSEYAILVDQSGNKRYEKGPQIVFPLPTEEFFQDDGGNIKFKPIELTPTQGLHIKINCDHTDKEWPSGTRIFHEGEEVFITGETHPIYYPREEHSIVRYGDNLIHFATAVSSGQARYVMDKNTGEITTRQGPDMILLDPTKEVFVQRVLSDAESLLMYPGNQDSLDYNRSLRKFQVSKGLESTALTSEAMAADFGDSAITRTSSKLLAAEAALPDQFRRKTTYTKPHSVTLDDRFNGVPTLKVWTGFAVLLVKADGTRRVEVGPKVVTLDYDETTSALHLSTGKPKTTDKLLTTGYLEVSNNKVSDIIRVETQDGVEVDLKVSYRVSFEGDPMQWFNVDNYVKFLCDHARSRLKGEARRHSIRDFYNDTVDIVRDTILGKKVEGTPRSGLTFEENGMVVTEVDLLGVVLVDDEIERLLVDQQQAVVTDQIAIDRANQQLEVDKARQVVEKEKLALQEELRIARHELELAKLEDAAAIQATTAANSKEKAAQTLAINQKMEEANEVVFQAELERNTRKQELEVLSAQAATEQIVARFNAASGDLAAAIRDLGDEQVLKTVAEAMGPMRLIGGGTLTDALAGIIGAPGDKHELFQRLKRLVDGKK